MRSMTLPGNKTTANDSTRFGSRGFVEVLSPLEILAMLDDNGSLDGHPFMPEIVDYCGHCFRISRRVAKTCVLCAFEKRVVTTQMRKFLNNHVVFLE